MMKNAKAALPNSLQIGELASRTGRSVHTIRWYESQGLMPGVMRDDGRRRLYSEHHVGWLDMMERLRSTGMSIAQLREYTDLVKQGRATLTERRAVLAAHRQRVEENIAKWNEALQLIDAKIDFYGEWIANGQRPAVTPPQRLRQAKRAAKRRAGAEAKGGNS